MIEVNNPYSQSYISNVPHTMPFPHRGGFLSTGHFLEEDLLGPGSAFDALKQNYVLENIPEAYIPTSGRPLPEAPLFDQTNQEYALSEYRGSVLDDMRGVEGASYSPVNSGYAPYHPSQQDTGLLGSVSSPPSPLLKSAASAVPIGASGHASVDTLAGTGLPYAGQGISEELAAQTAAESGTSAWGGPATVAANLALNMIPTRDRDKVDTPLGDEGSMSGILKGTGKGALTGATIGSFFPGPGTLIGGLVGGGVGLIGGTQGYFDSTSAPTITMSRIKRRGGGMQGGLLGGGSMYG